MAICPICEVEIKTSKVSTAFRRHLLDKHNVSTQEEYKEFLRNTYYPINHPEKIRLACETCGNSHNRFVNFFFGFSETCSHSCGAVLYYKKSFEEVSQRFEKIKQTNLSRYGVEFPTQNEEIREKGIQTCINKYGTNSTLKLETIKNKIKRTNISRYGYENIFEIPGFQKSVLKKRKQTCLKRYGVDNVSKVPLFQEDVVIKKKRNYFPIFKNSLLRRELELTSDLEKYLSGDALDFKCTNCGEMFSKDTRKVNYIICRKCKPLKVSRQELEITSFIKHYIDKEIDRNLKCLRFSNDSYPKEIDIYIPSHKLGIELDGLYWYSDIEDPKYHLRKTNSAKDIGIQLLHITDYEWDNKQEIIKSIILSKLGIYRERIFARKCEIREVPNKEYKEFLEDNHLQGYCSAKLRLGLYHQNKLVQLCSFSKSRFKRDEIELIRHCSLINYQVLGGLSRLLKHYMRNYHPSDGTKLITYVDRRYSNGSGYESVGFGNKKFTGINYWYTGIPLNWSIESRQKYQKHKLSKLLENFDPSLTEMENMRNHGYSIYYDCGSYKLEYN